VIEEQAKVVSIEDNSTFIVESTVKSTCSGCQQLESCGSGQISKAFPQKKLTYRLHSDEIVNVGDNVVIGLSESILLSSAWQVYMWPLLGLISASLLAQWLLVDTLFAHELFALMIGVLGGYIGFIAAKSKQAQISNCQKWTPSLIRNLGSNISVTEILD